ncbi:MAG: hypothetical protein IPK12_23420 [Gemmatimonadetes bacterium]|nr:hypothetical protein [Gemmatimonadota bacterium]
MDDDGDIRPAKLAAQADDRATAHADAMLERIRIAAETGHDPGAAADASARRTWDIICRGLRP